MVLVVLEVVNMYIYTWRRSRFQVVLVVPEVVVVDVGLREETQVQLAGQARLAHLKVQITNAFPIGYIFKRGWSGGVGRGQLNSKLES